MNDITRVLLEAFLYEMGAEIDYVAAKLDDGGIGRDTINAIVGEQMFGWTNYDGERPSADDIAEMIHDMWNRIDRKAVAESEMQRASMLAAHGGSAE